MTTLRYVYAIVRASDAASVEAAEIAGIDGARVRAVVEGPLAAAASEVDDRTYAADSLNERVRDMDWLTPRAAAHQSVNARLLDLAGTVLPLSFGALYAGDERVRQMLRDDVARRTERLAALDGQGEWVVTVIREGVTPVTDDTLRELDREIAASGPGRAFLLEKRRTTVASEVLERSDEDAARRALASLTEVSERTYREPVVAGGADTVVLRVSVLAPRSGAPALEDRIASLGTELARHGYAVRTTGPWPAYRFGALE